MSFEEIRWKTHEAARKNVAGETRLEVDLRKVSEDVSYLLSSLALSSNGTSGKDKEDNNIGNDNTGNPNPNPNPNFFGYQALLADLSC